MSVHDMPLYSTISNWRHIHPNIFSELCLCLTGAANIDRYECFVTADGPLQSRSENPGTLFIDSLSLYILKFRLHSYFESAFNSWVSTMICRGLANWCTYDYAWSELSDPQWIHIATILSVLWDFSEDCQDPNQTYAPLGSHSPSWAHNNELNA